MQAKCPQGVPHTSAELPLVAVSLAQEQPARVDVDGEEAPRADKLGARPFHAVHEGAVGPDDDAGLGTAEV
jgi:hypothetical protein